MITSNQNNKIKYLKQLYKSSKRKERGKFILEGYRIIKQALDVGAEVEYIFMTPAFRKSAEAKAMISREELDGITFLLNHDLLEKIADTVTPQGVIAVVDEIDCDFDSLVKTGNKIIVLDRVQDPGNMGTIIRTAAAAGFAGVISLKGSVDIYNLKVLRATAGAIFNIPFINKMTYDDLSEQFSKKLADYQLIGTDPATDKYYYDQHFNKKSVLVIGNEANGIRKKLLKKMDLSIKIPLNNKVESINAAMAAGIIMYNIKYS